jgi:hypothetical protein
MVNPLLISTIHKFKGLAPQLEARNSTSNGRLVQIYLVTLSTQVGHLFNYRRAFLSYCSVVGGGSLRAAADAASLVGLFLSPQY